MPRGDLLFQRLESTREKALRGIASSIYKIRDANELSKPVLVEELSKEIRSCAGHTFRNWFRAPHDLEYKEILFDVVDKMSTWAEWWTSNYKRMTALELEERIWELHNQVVKAKLDGIPESERNKKKAEIEASLRAKGFSQKVTTAVTASLFGAGGAVLGPVIAAQVAAASLTGFAAFYASIFGAAALGGAAAAGAAAAGAGIAALPFVVYYLGSPSMKKTVPAVIGIIQERKIEEELSVLGDEFKDLTSILDL